MPTPTRKPATRANTPSPRPTRGRPTRSTSGTARARHEGSEERAARPLRVIGYVRVSTEDQGNNGYGLAAQRDAIEAYCEAQGYQLLTVTTDVMTTRRTEDMHGRAVAIAAIAAGLADALLVRALDRVTRSTLDGAQLLDQAKRQGWRLLGLDGTDSGDPKQSLVNNLKIAIAEGERDKISERTKEGLARARREGKQLGRPRKITPTVARRIVRYRVKDGLSAQGIAALLTQKKVPTPGGGPQWHHSTVRSVLAREGVQ